MTEQANDTAAKPHSSHWGAFSGQWLDGKLVITPHPIDPDPNPIIQNFPEALRHKARIAKPMVRRGWLENGPGKDDRRGRDAFVELEWDEVLDLLTGELKRVKDKHGAGAIFGGSYGWSSAGRFHHAQSQVHRFLNMALGGYVRSVNSYSAGASAVLIPHILGNYDDLTRCNVGWDEVVEHTDIVLAFGGMNTKNSRVAGGGIYALGAIANYGRRQNAVPIAGLPQGKNGVPEFIPVARISDMLLNPGTPFDYNGQRLNYPDIKLVYWAGGNPFHHHQDINRLRRAFAQVETLVVHEIAWTATARHADIVLPVTMTLEREDTAAASRTTCMTSI